MSPNKHLDPQLDAFAALSKPGFAMMIDAPWGAGKTFSIRKWLGQRKHLYVSLYGASNREDVERAIFLARLALIDNGTTRAVATLLSAGMDALAAHYKINKSIKVTDVGQAALPQLMIFDDLERASMAPTDLLSVLNRYVEHESRNVILIGNQSELRRSHPSEYEMVREKVVGRVISLEPDTSSALSKFFDSLENENGQREASEVLRGNCLLIEQVFKAVGDSNLRLLRQALLEFGRHYGLLPAWIKENEYGLKYLLATFVALSVSYHGSKHFGIDDLRQSPDSKHRIWVATGKKGEEPALSPIEILQQSCSDIEFVNCRGGVISPMLAAAWIEKGHADAAIIDHELKKAAVFSKQNTEAWQVLWNWQTRPAGDVENALTEVAEQMHNKEITHPSVILHIAGIMLDLGSEGIGWDTEGEAKKAALCYVNDLEMAERLPTEYYGGFSVMDGWPDSSFGLGYTSRNTQDFDDIRTELFGALERSFWKENRKRVEDLFSTLPENAKIFAASLSGNVYQSDISDYSGVPILSGIDPHTAAKMIFSQDPLIINTCLKPFKERFQRFSREAANSNVGAEREVNWLKDFRAAAEELTKTSGSIVAAQIRRTIERQLTFSASTP